MGWDDDRAVSEVLGAMLLFGILILAIGSYQAFIVPQANEDIEFKHNQQVQGEMQELRSVINTVETSDSSGSKTISTGTDYPSRVFAINSPPPAGTVRTVGTTDDNNVTIENAVATNNDAADYWNGETHEFRSGQLVYRPNYNYYRNGPRTVIDHSVVFNEFNDGTQLTTTDQRLIKGNRIRIGTLGGDRSFSRTRSTIDVTPVSAGTTTTTITAESGEPYLNITIPTQLSESKWEGLLGTEDNFKHVTSNGDGTTTISLDANEHYNLQMSRVSVGPETETVKPHYLVRSGPHDRFVNQQEQTAVTVQVRDKYNNPVSGVEVEFEQDANDPHDVINLDSTVTTDENGEATSTFVTPEDNTSVTIHATVQEVYNVDTQRGRVTFEVDVGPFDAGAEGQLNPNDVLLVGQDLNGDALTFEMRTIDGVENFTRVRYNLFAITSGSGTPPAEITDVQIDGSGSLASPATRGGEFSPLDGDQGRIHTSPTDVVLTFDAMPGGAQRALVVVTFQTEDGKRLQYLVGIDP